MGSIAAIAGVLGFLPMNYVVVHFGVKNGMLVCCILCIIGQWMVCMIAQNFYYCVAGQFVIHFAMQAMSAAKSKFIAKWWVQNDRQMVFTIIGVCVGLSYFLRSILLSMVVGKKDVTLPVEEIRDRVLNFCLFNLALVVLHLLLSYFLL